MTTIVFLAVLCAAALHATWNSLVKASSDKFAIMLVVLGILSLTLVHRTSGVRNPAAVGMALATGVFIAGYSLVDGMGARAAGTALGYWSWSAIGSGVIFFLWAAMFQRSSVKTAVTDRKLLLFGLAGGTASYLAYAIVVWAFTHAPIALVTALRETSIVFALLIGVGVLKEPLNLIKLLSTALTIGGVFVLRLSRG